MRGESNVQGSTDHGLLFHIWTGYLGAPTASLKTLNDFNEKATATERKTNALVPKRNAAATAASIPRATKLPRRFRHRINSNRNAVAPARCCGSVIYVESIDGICTIDTSAGV